MAMARHAMGRVLVSLARQAVLSMAGTIVATVVIAALQHGSPFIQARMAASPELTSGGKFAARADAAADTDVAQALPLLPPLRALSMASAERTPAASLTASPEIQPDHKPPADLTKTARHTTRADARRRPVAEAGRDVVPPRRADYVGPEIAAVAEAAGPAAIEAGDGTGLWSSAKLILRRTTTDGIALLDHFMP